LKFRRGSETLHIKAVKRRRGDLEHKSGRFQVNRELLKNSSTKAIKEELRGVGWPVYKDYEAVEEDGEPFVVASISLSSFFETEPAEEYFAGEEKTYRVQRSAGRWPSQDAMSIYPPLQAPELVLELAELAEKEITPEAVLEWAQVYGLLGFPDEDTVTDEGLVKLKVKGEGRRESVRRFAEAARDVRGCLRTYEAITSDRELEPENLLSVAALLPRKAFVPFGPMEDHLGKERPWLFRVLGRLVQIRLDQYCYPRFSAFTRNGVATGKFALTWGFKGLIGAIWLHMAWLLEAESERVKRCKLPDCLRVIHFEPGKPASIYSKKHTRGKYKTREDKVYCSHNHAAKHSYRKRAGWHGYN